MKLYESPMKIGDARGKVAARQQAANGIFN
jgi:hypothetical protein